MTLIHICEYICSFLQIEKSDLGCEWLIGERGFEGANLPISWLGASCFRRDILSADSQLILSVCYDIWFFSSKNQISSQCQKSAA